MKEENILECAIEAVKDLGCEIRRIESMLVKHQKGIESKTTEYPGKWTPYGSVAALKRPENRKYVWEIKRNRRPL